MSAGTCFSSYPATISCRPNRSVRGMKLNLLHSGFYKHFHYLRDPGVVSCIHEVIDSGMKLHQVKTYFVHFPGSIGTPKLAALAEQNPGKCDTYEQARGSWERENRDRLNESMAHTCQ